MRIARGIFLAIAAVGWPAWGVAVAFGADPPAALVAFAFVALGVTAGVDLVRLVLR